jgi:hypothetical protein
MNDKQRERAASAAARSIGSVVSVRIDPRTTVQGRIAACRVLDVAADSKSRFELTMICGIAAAERTFVVAKLPPPDVPPSDRLG